MIWDGVWNRERIIYSDIGSYFQFDVVEDMRQLYWDTGIWYDHYGWLDSKRAERFRVYAELYEKEKAGILPHPTR